MDCGHDFYIRYVFKINLVHVNTRAKVVGHIYIKVRTNIIYFKSNGYSFMLFLRFFKSKYPYLLRLLLTTNPF